MSVSLRPIEELERELEVREARAQRNQVLAAKRMRRRQTRARIVLGGAVLAEIRDGGDPEFIRKIVAILQSRVERERDREDLSNLIGSVIPSPAAEFPAKEGLPDFEALEAAAVEEGAFDRLLTAVKRSENGPDWTAKMARQVLRQNAVHPGLWSRGRNPAFD